MKKQRFILLFIMTLLLAALVGGLSGYAAPETEAPALSVADEEGHPALMTTDASGMFRPEQTVTRLELCRSLGQMLDGLPLGGRAVFSDIKVSDEGYWDALLLYASGVLPETEDGRLYPRQTATRGELTEILTRLAERLSGEEADRARELAEDTAAAGGGDGPIRRGELAAVLERIAGREPDKGALLFGGYLPPDVTTESDAWAYIADAVTDGEIPTAEGGVHRAGGWLYAAWDDGSMIVDMDYGVWTFGLDGRYTTGDAELDGYLLAALEESGANELSGEEALAAAYLYVKDNFEYLVRPEDMTTLEVGETGWEYERALRFFRYGGGTCYGFAAAFGLLARALGENAYIVSAQVNEYYSPHGFVIIPEDGTDWIYDVELENTRRERHPDLALFHIYNHQVYHYWYTPDWGGI